MDLALDFSVWWVPCSVVRILTVSRKLSSTDEILYLILQIEAHRSRVTVSVVEQAELVLVLLRDVFLYWQQGTKLNVTLLNERLSLPNDSRIE